jgi:autophagy-related protein 18
MRDMKVLHTIRDVPSNREGLCALSSNSDNSYLAYPGSSITGEVQVFDTLNLVCRKYILFHLLTYFLYIETRDHDKCS